MPFVKAATEQAMQWYDADKLGASRLAIGNAIRLMCRAAKSREGDHFAAAIGLREQLEGFVPVIPDWANDKHTIAGRKLGLAWTISGERARSWCRQRNGRLRG